MIASSSTIPLSQLQNMAPSSLSTGKEKSTADNTNTNVVSKQLASPVVIILDDSLEETIKNTPPVIKQEGTSKETIEANPSPFYPVCEESPVLFETPSSVGCETLSVKLAKRALSKDGGPNQPLLVDVKKNNHPFSSDSPCKMEVHVYVDQPEDKPSPLKCEAAAMSTVFSDVPSGEETTDDIDSTPPLSHQKPRTPPGTLKPKLSLSTVKGGTTTMMGGVTPSRGTDSSPMGQPRIRRSNVRLASKRDVDNERTPLSSKVRTRQEVREDVKPLKEKWMVGVYDCMEYGCMALCCILLQGKEVSCSACELTLAKGKENKTWLFKSYDFLLNCICHLYTRTLRVN